MEGVAELLAAADELFLGSGVSRSRAGSKLARAVGATDPELSSRLALKPSARGRRAS